MISELGRDCKERVWRAETHPRGRLILTTRSPSCTVKKIIILKTWMSHKLSPGEQKQPYPSLISQGSGLLLQQTAVQFLLQWVPTGHVMFNSLLLLASPAGTWGFLHTIHTC